MSDSAGHSVRSPWVRRIIIGLVLVAVGYLGAVALASRYLDPVALASLLEPRLERALGRDVEVSGVDVGFFPLSMRIRDLVVSDPTGLAPELATVGSVEFQVQLIPLLRREVRIRRILVQDPVAHLRVSEEGLSNYGDFSPQNSEAAEDPEASGQPLSLELKSIRVSGGSLSLANGADSVELDLAGLLMEARVQHEAGNPWFFSGRSSTTLILPPRERVRGAAPLQIPLALSFDVEASEDFEEMEIREGRLGVDPAELSLTGSVSRLRNPVRSVRFRISGTEIPLSTLFEALPKRVGDSLPVRGEGTVSLEISGQGELGPGVRPEVSGQVTLARGTFLARDNSRLAEFLDVGLTLGEDGALMVEAEGEVMDGPFSLSGTVELPDQRRVDLHVQAYPELSVARPLLPDSPKVEMAGRIRADAQVTGSLRDLRTLRLRGEATPSDFSLSTEALPVPITIHEGRFALLGRDATFRGLSFSLGRDRFSAEGSVGNLTAMAVTGEVLQLRGTVRGPRLDLTTLTEKEPPDSILSFGKVVFAHLGGRSVAGRSVQDAARELRLARPDSLPIAGEVTLVLDTLINRKGAMENVQATVGFGPEFIRVTQASFQRYGGTLVAWMNLRLGEASRQPFSFSVAVQGVDAGSFLGATSPLGHVFRGRMDLQLDMAGALDAFLLPEASSLLGSGTFSLQDGGMNATVLSESLANFLGLETFRAPSFQNWSSAFVVEDGRVRLAEATLTGAPGDPRVGGGVGLDGTLDLLSTFNLSTERLSTYAMRNLGVVGELAGRTANRPDLVQAVIRIGGSALSPELEVGPGGGAVPVLQEAETEAQRRIREQSTNLQNRASSFLRRMIQGTPPATAGTDSLLPDSLRGDTLLPDTLPTDTVQPDTIRPDTVQPDTVPPDTLPPDTTLYRPRGEGEEKRPGNRSG